MINVRPESPPDVTLRNDHQRSPVEVIQRSPAEVIQRSPSEVIAREDVLPCVSLSNSHHSVQSVAMASTSPSQSASANGGSPVQEMMDTVPPDVNVSAHPTQPAHMVPSRMSQTTHLMNQSHLGSVTQPTYSAMKPVCSSISSKFLHF